MKTETKKVISNILREKKRFAYNVSKRRYAEVTVKKSLVFIPYECNNNNNNNANNNNSSNNSVAAATAIR